MRGHLRTAGVGLAIAAGLLASQHAGAGDGPDRAPLVRFLAPLDGRTLNADVLRARVVAVGAQRQAPTLRRVELSLDGQLIESLDLRACRREILVEFSVALASLADGAHELVATAYEGHSGRRGNSSARAAFILDRTLPVAESGSVEEHATPQAFACLELRDAGGQDRLRLRGTFTPGYQSNGIDLHRDSIVMALGPDVIALEPDDLRCRERGRDRVACRLANTSNLPFDEIAIRQSGDGRWTFDIDARWLPQHATTFYLRVGDDWGGVDLETGAAITDLRLDLDLRRKAVVTVGSEGGTIETTDADGVRMRLDVPPGALTAGTAVGMTPLVTSPVVDQSEPLHPGVKFEPEGLVFAQPATLTLDFSRTAQPVDLGHFIFLVTSPLTTVPLWSAADPAAKTLTAAMSHFSSAQAGPPGITTNDVAALRAILNRPLQPPLSISQLRSVAGLVAVWQEKLSRGQLPGISAADLIQLLDLLMQKGLDWIDVHIDAVTQLLQTNPASEGVAERLLELEGLRRTFGAPGFKTEDDARRNLEARINLAAASPAPMTPATRVDRLLQLAVLAQAFGMPDVSDLAFRKIFDFVRAGIVAATNLCRTDEAAGRAALQALQPAAAHPLVVQEDASLLADVDAAIASCRVTPPITVTIVPQNITVRSGDSATFTATVNGGTNGVVFTGSGGAIVPTGPLTGIYTAASVGGLFQVTATSVDDPSQSASAVVNVVAPLGLEMIFSCSDPVVRFDVVGGPFGYQGPQPYIYTLALDDGLAGIGFRITPEYPRGIPEGFAVSNGQNGRHAASLTVLDPNNGRMFRGTWVWEFLMFTPDPEVPPFQIQRLRSGPCQPGYVFTP